MLITIKRKINFIIHDIIDVDIFSKYLNIFFLFLLDSTLNKSLCEMLYIDFDFALSQRLLFMFYFYFLRRIL